MTPSQLKHETRNTAPYFFSRKTMKHFGDTMKNYGVRTAKLDGIEVWELYRKQPTTKGHGLTKSAFFDKKTFKQIKI